MKLLNTNYKFTPKMLYWAKARLSWIFNPHAKAWGKYRNTNNIQSNTYPIIYGGDLKSNQHPGVLTPFWSGLNFSLIFILAITLLISCSEKTISEDKLQERNGVYYEVNETRPFSGTAVEKYRDGQIEEENKFKNGELIGEIRWYKNGQMEKEVNYKNGERHGVHTIWYENGQKREEENFKDGELVE